MLATLAELCCQGQLISQTCQEIFGCGLQKIVVPLITRVTLAADNANDFRFTRTFDDAVLLAAYSVEDGRLPSGSALSCLLLLLFVRPRQRRRALYAPRL